MEIGTLDIAVSRRSGRVAGGAASQNSSHGTTSNTTGQRPLTAGAFQMPANSRNVYGIDSAENEYSRNDLQNLRGLSQNPLSDGGSKFGDEDAMSHYLGQSEYGGISNLGAPPDQNDFGQQPAQK